jgi:hypothetical protein
MVANLSNARIPVSCWLGLYVLADKALLPTTCKTEAGIYRDSNPHIEIDYRDSLSLVTALKSAYLAGNPAVPSPTKEERSKLAPTAAAAKVKSWAELERKSIFFGIRCYSTHFIVESWARSSDGGWSDSKSFEISIPVEMGIEAVARAILDHLATRNDLPGLMLGPGSPEAKGA